MRHGALAIALVLGTLSSSPAHAQPTGPYTGRPVAVVLGEIRGRHYEIVGVVGDTKYQGLREPMLRTMFIQSRDVRPGHVDDRQRQR